MNSSSFVECFFISITMCGSSCVTRAFSISAWETVVSSLPIVGATLRLAWLEQMVDATEYLSCQALRVAWTHSVERNLAGWIFGVRNSTRRDATFWVILNRTCLIWSGRAVACGGVERWTKFQWFLACFSLESLRTQLLALDSGGDKENRCVFFFSVLQGPKLAADAGILNLWNLCPFWLFHQMTDMSHTCGIDRNWWYWRRLQHWNLAGKQKQACCDNGVCVACLLSTHQHGYAMRVAYGDLLIQLRCLQ